VGEKSIFKKEPEGTIKKETRIDYRKESHEKIGMRLRGRKGKRGRAQGEGNYNTKKVQKVARWGKARITHKQSLLPVQRGRGQGRTHQRRKLGKNKSRRGKCNPIAYGLSV